MAQCEILYSGDLGDIRKSLKRYLKNGENETIFMDSFIKGEFPKLIRYTKTTMDTSNATSASIISFTLALDITIEALILKTPSIEASLRKLQLLVQTRLNIDLDESQSGSIVESEDSLETKTLTEIRDLNTANLEEHLKEIYGTGAYDIIKTLKEKFDDNTTSAAYWDINSGEVVLRSNIILNTNFLTLKNRYYKKIVLFLKAKLPLETQNLNEDMIVNGKFIGSEYFNTLSRFYNYIKSLDTFSKDLTRDQSLKLRRTIHSLKEELYKGMMLTLNDNSEFRKSLGTKYNNKKASEMLNLLYTADHFSEYFREAKRIVNSLKLGELKIGSTTINQIIELIEDDELTLLEAANSYTSLIHFDKLLLELHGNSFSIESGLEGIEMGDTNKYSYHLDTAHEKKSWQLSESVNSEKYIANLTRRVLNLIRIFDYKTNSYKNRRADSTSYIVAARNLLNDIFYNNISWINIPTDFNNPRRQQFDAFINLAISIHSNPESRFQKVLEYLFDKADGNQLEFYKNIGSRKLLTDYDLDILYSIYNAVYNKLNPSSLISQELKNLKGADGIVLNLVLEISGFVDRNTTMDYLETSYDFESGQVSIKVKKKFFNNRQLYKTRVSINSSTNGVTLERAKQLKDKYNFLILPALNGKVYYQTTLNGILTTLQVPDIGGKILSNNDKISFEDKSIFNIIDQVDLVDFREKILMGASLSDSEQTLHSMLGFIDDHLGFNILGNPSFGLSVLLTYKTIYSPKPGKVIGDNFMMPLVLLAMRAAYANSRYSEANGKPLGLYLEGLGLEDDGIYNIFKNSKNSKLFSSKYGNIKYNIAGFNDEVLNIWTDAQSMLTGEASKATTKDKEGNSIPNNSVNKLGSIIHHYLMKLETGNTSSLLFAQNKSLIRSTFHDLEVTTLNNDTKLIKNFSGGELFFHSIFNKFWGNYLNTGNVIILPTTYSDKTTFINYEINTKLNGVDDIMKSANYSLEAIQLYIDTLGTMYSNVWNSTKNKLQKIANVYNIDNNVFLTFKLVLNNVSEDELNKLAKRASVDIELDKDYRIVKIKGKTVTSVNEELEYYATLLYTNKNILEKVLSNEKINFVLNLIDSNSSFLVIDYGDSIDNYLDDKISSKASSKNTVINTIKEVFRDNVDHRKLFLQNWVDLKTGKLILAKLGNSNILGIGNNFDNRLKVELNPLLDKFFYIESLLSNNIRMNLTGSEINHPNKAKKTLYNAIKSGEITNFELVGITTQLEISQLLDILNTTNTIADLNVDFFQNLNNVSPKIVKVLHTIYGSSILLIVNTSLGTLFKRNVIIPATLLYCLLNVRDGIPPRIKCAAIRDESAEVWNYRGDHEDSVDSSDGSAQINPFLSILENRSLGSQAVGFIKKPIWHAYDVESGTAFLAKFATDTITNEAMRMSLGSHTKLFNLFKKMTNLQWEGDVDLTESIIFGKIGGDTSKIGDLNKWFLTTILGNTIIPNSQGFDTYIKENRLIYKDYYGDKIEIVGFDKTVSEELNLYYTKETVFTQSSFENPEVDKVYHVFYNDGVNISKHITFDTDQKALSFINSTPGAHSINSLFELHTALGGINCVNTKGADSEFTNEVVVNFMNTVGKINDGFDLKRDIINLETYNLPLKNYHIGYALNNTAVKNGAKNMNQSNAWYDDSELNYFEVDSDGLGMLMNADHDIIDSLLTEFSLVITATSAYGYTHDLCNEIFLGLASAALLASKKTLDAVNNFINLNFEGSDVITAQSDLYDSIGRIIFTNLSIKDRESLQGVIIEAVNKVFYKSKNHLSDSFKIPFSDANIYSDFISTLASTINKDSIRRKHPGSGCVMVPAYNMLLYFEVEGLKLLTTDILNLAREDYKLELLNMLRTAPNYSLEYDAIIDGEDTYYLNNLPTRYLEELLNKVGIDNNSGYYYLPTESGVFKPDTTLLNNILIQKYLEKNQSLVKIYNDSSWFMPSDIVDILGINGEIITVDLDSLDKYYKFKDGIFDIELANKVRIDVDYSKNKYKISLNEDPLSLFIIEGEVINNKPTGKYNIHFKTGGFDLNLLRRTVSSLSEELKIRLFKATLETIPDNSILRLSPSTAELVKTGIGGLTQGSIAGYNSIISNSARTEGINIVQTGNTYDVTYTDKNGILQIATIAEYLKLGSFPKGYLYRENITRPHNLRPSLIRWKYNDGISESFMNIFDTPVIKDAYTKPSYKDKDYRKLILKVLHDLTEGVFIDRGGLYRTLIPGSLENTSAELIMSNIYKDKFGIEDLSLSVVLNKGEDFFRKKYNKLNAPTNTLYDVAFTRDGGNHTLIKLGNITPNGYVKELPFDMGLLSTNEKDEIILMKGNKELFEVGRWVDNSDKIIYLNGIFIDTFGNPVLNQNYYRLKNLTDHTSILKRVDYLTRYLVTDKIVTKSGKVIYKTNTLYNIANLNNFVEILGNEVDAAKLLSSIVRKIFLTDNYKLAQINTNISWNAENLNHVRSALGNLQSNYYVNQDVKNLLSALINSIQTSEKTFNPSLNLKEEAIQKEEFKKIRLANLVKYKELLKQFLDNEAHKKWISFLDSLKYIVSRIPALTLLSFMTMKQVAWTLNSKNMAYVSHFLIYLLGSDY